MADQHHLDDHLRADGLTAVNSSLEIGMILV
jgi:hypothetical protein